VSRAAQRIVRVVIRGGLQVIEIVAVRENSAIPFLRGLRERLLPAPGLDDRIRINLGTEDFIPADQDLAVFLDNPLDADGEVGEKILIRFQTVLARECLYVRRLRPRTSSPPIWKQGSGKSAAISPMKASRNV